MADNTYDERGFGKWIFYIYQPTEKIGPYTGVLKVNKDYHIIMYQNKDNKTYCVVSIPSPNVSYAVNTLVVQQE